MGPGAGIYRSRHDGEYQLEPVPSGLPPRNRHRPAPCLYGLSVGWRYRQHPRHGHRGPDEPHPDAGNGGQLVLQRTHRLPQDCRYPGLRHPGMEVHPSRKLCTIHSGKYREGRRIRLLGHLARSRHCLFRLSGLRRGQHGCPGNQESETGHAHRYPGIVAGLHHPVYPLRPCHDGSSTLHRFPGASRYRPRSGSHRAHGNGRCFRRHPTGLSVVEQGHHPGHPLRVLLRHHGDIARTEPCLPEHEPRRPSPTLLLTHQRTFPYPCT